jgi:hypothetical protein
VAEESTGAEYGKGRFGATISNASAYLVVIACFAS